jgi:O-antigen/teichoic acid export membrane protein
LKKFSFQNKDVYKLISGTALAQAIPFIFSPLLSRLYEPSDYALIGLMLAAGNILTEFTSFKFERTIVLEEDRKTAANILMSCFGISTIISILLLIILLIFKSSINQMQIHQSIGVLVYVLPPIVWAMSFIIASNFWFQRIKEYYRIATNKVVQMASITFISLYFGYINLENGLIIAYLSGWLILLFYTLFQIKKTNVKWSDFDLKISKTALSKFSHFPKYNLLPSLLNTFALSLPYYLITMRYGEDMGGHFNMCKQLILIPAGFISTAFAQIYFRKFAEAINHHQSILTLFYSMMKPVLGIGFIMLFSVGFFGDIIFEIVLGSNWKQAGEIGMVYIFAIFTQYISITLMIILPVLNLVKQESVFKIIYFLVIIILFLQNIPNQSEFILYYTLTEVVLFGGISAYIIYQVFKYEKLKHAK